MRIAILGATSQIAKDMIVLMSSARPRALELYARRPADLVAWLQQLGLDALHVVRDLAEFESADAYDAIVNFIGVGDPAAAQKMGASILEITQRYDQSVLLHLQANPSCKYIFLSSGVAFGNQFSSPVDMHSRSQWDVNNLAEQDWFGMRNFMRRPATVHFQSFQS